MGSEENLVNHKFNLYSMPTLGFFFCGFRSLWCNHFNL